jgi:hypothetical protein
LSTWLTHASNEDRPHRHGFERDFGVLQPWNWPQGRAGVTLDLSRVVFLGSSGISARLHTRDGAFRANVPLKLVGPSR